MKLADQYIHFAEALSEKTGSIIQWLTTIMVAVVCIDVITRYLFKNSSVAIQELEWHLFSLIFLLGAAYTLKADRHVRVDVFYSNFSERNKALVNFIGILLFLIPFSIVIISGSFNFVMNSFRILETSPDPGGLPARFLLKACIPISFILVLIQGIALALKSLFCIIESKEQTREVSNG